MSLFTSKERDTKTPVQTAGITTGCCRWRQRTTKNTFFAATHFADKHLCCCRFFPSVRLSRHSPRGKYSLSSSAVFPHLPLLLLLQLPKWKESQDRNSRASRHDFARGKKLSGGVYLNVISQSRERGKIEIWDGAAAAVSILLLLLFLPPTSSPLPPRFKATMATAATFLKKRRESGRTPIGR